MSYKYKERGSRKMRLSPKAMTSVMDKINHRSTVNHGCKMWGGCTDPAGYGLCQFRGRRHRVHEAAWSAANGGAEVPKGRWVVQTCGRRCCITPEHLVLVDRPARIIHQGSANKCAKWEEWKVRLVLSATGTLKEISTQFGMPISTVARMRARKSWLHVVELPNA